MAPERKVSVWLTNFLIGAEIVCLLWFERRRPLRPAVEGKVRRSVRNLAVAGLAALAVQLAEKPVVEPLARAVVGRRWGLLQRFSWPLWLQVALSIAAMDYTLYLWHRLIHRAPPLWRHHLPHHVDLDLDASTALRFHFGELILSVPWRAGQILLIGTSPLALSLWQTFLMLSILFHHSNIELPAAVERRLAWLIVTPRLHGIHHSTVREQTESNWSSGLTIWDWLHGTLKTNVAQDSIIIGVPAYRDPTEVSLAKVLAMPFKRQRPTWTIREINPPIDSRAQRR